VAVQVVKRNNPPATERRAFDPNYDPGNAHCAEVLPAFPRFFLG